MLGGVLACVSPNTEHCGRNAGAITCAERYPGFEHCSVCVAERDGCVAEPVNDPNCLPKDLPAGTDSLETSGETQTETDASGSQTQGETEDSGENSTADPTDLTTEEPTTEEPTTEEPTTEEPTTEEPTTEEPTTEDPTDDPEPMCGNNQLEEGEYCDTDQLGGANCLDFGFGGGMLACDDTCQFDATDCCQIAGGACDQLGAQCCPGLTCGLLSGVCG